MDGLPSRPMNLKVECNFYNISGRTAVSVQWDPPSKPNGIIESYQVALKGQPLHFDYRTHMLRNDYNMKMKSVSAVNNTEFENVMLNTNYTVTVMGVTRHRAVGEPASASCLMPRAAPELHRVTWSKVRSNTDSALFQVHMPHLTERNGPICGYRFYLVRLPASASNEVKLPPIHELPITTYKDAHAMNNTKIGAYIARTISQRSFRSPVTLGDGMRLYMQSPTPSEFPNIKNEQCRKMLQGLVNRKPENRTNSAGEFRLINTDRYPLFNSTEILSEAEKKDEELPRNKTVIAAGKLKRRRRRRHNLSPNLIQDENDVKATSDPVPLASFPTIDSPISGFHIMPGRPPMGNIYDGRLDPNSNYTGFVEVIGKRLRFSFRVPDLIPTNFASVVDIDDESEVMSAFSEYFDIMNGGPLIEEEEDDNSIEQILNLVTQILCGLILLVLVLLTALCVMHRVNTKKHASQGHDVISLRDSLSRALCGGRAGQNHRHLIGNASAKPPDIGPIPRNELFQAYVTRHKDTDYGFLREYEMLPHRFNDRTTKASDAKENSGKNRYPDIKSYDQTRVRLSERTTNGVATTSDYINANFVLGYKERKKFICAQGPMDTTINDFWRMIWEQHLEIIVMLTNLEEYNKAKCAKYWPEEINDATKFGEITVKFIHEQRFSDYLIRELKVTRASPSNSTASGSSSGGEEEEEERHITQYHYLAWKDFMDPELGVIRFIRHINEVYSVQRGPILVHCSGKRSLSI